VSLDGAAPELKLGQTARVYFASTDTGGQRIIPLSALYERTGQAAVWVVDARTHQVHLTPIDVAAYHEQGVVVSAGVDATQWIVTAGVHKLREGDTIAPVDTANRPVIL
jgi:multidrug efflux system membrane fusion protein